MPKFTPSISTVPAPGPQAVPRATGASPVGEALQELGGAIERVAIRRATASVNADITNDFLANRQFLIERSQELAAITDLNERQEFNDRTQNDFNEFSAETRRERLEGKNRLYTSEYLRRDEPNRRQLGVEVQNSQARAAVSIDQSKHVAGINGIASIQATSVDALNSILGQLDTAILSAAASGSFSGDQLGSAIGDPKARVVEGFYAPLIDNEPETALEFFNQDVGLSELDTDDRKKLGDDIRTAFREFPEKQRTEQAMAEAVAKPELMRAAIDGRMNIVMFNELRRQGNIPEALGDFLEPVIRQTTPRVLSQRIASAGRSDLGRILEEARLKDKEGDLTSEETNTMFERVFTLLNQGKISEASALGAVEDLGRMEFRAIENEKGATNRMVDKAVKAAGDFVRLLPMALTGGLSGAGTPFSFDLDRTQLDELDREVDRQLEAYIEDNGLIDADRWRLNAIVSEVRSQRGLTDEDLNRENLLSTSKSIMEEAGDFFMQGLEPRITGIPKEDRPDAVFIRTQGRIRRVGAPPVVVGVGAPSAEPPETAIQHLVANPNLADAFDRKYGDGAAESVLSAR